MTKIDVRSDTGPFAIIPEWVLNQEISPTAIRLYCMLALMADRRDLTSRPSRAYLAKRCRCSLRHIARALVELQQVGALQVEHRRKKDAFGEDTKELEANLYTIVRQIPGMSLGKDTGVLTPQDTRGTENQRVFEPDSSEDFSEEKSSSSSEEEEDFLNPPSVSAPEGDGFMEALLDHYLKFQLDPGFVSAVKSPGQYFRTLRQRNDTIPPCDLSACSEVALTIQQAVTVGYEEEKIVTYPAPLSLAGLAECVDPIRRYPLPPQYLRLALYKFCCRDEVEPPELQGSDILERIAKRPDLFAEALTQLSLSLG